MNHELLARAQTAAWLKPAAFTSSPIGASGMPSREDLRHLAMAGSSSTLFVMLASQSMWSTSRLMITAWLLRRQCQEGDIIRPESEVQCVLARRLRTLPRKLQYG